MSLRTIAASLAAVGLIASLPAGASAAKLSRKVDPDRDGLSTRAEKRIGTKARVADTDRDGLNDGREVRLGSNPLKADTDGNGTPDGRQLRGGEHPCGPATAGTVDSVDTSAATVTITLADSTSKTVTVNNATVLRGITDRDGSGAPTIADLQAGDQVLVRTSADDPSVATMIAVKGAGHGDHGNYVEGTATAVGTDSITVTLSDGSSKDFTVNSSTEIKGPDRDGSGSVTLADIAVGDKVEVEASSSDATVASEIKVKGTKVWGTIASIGSGSVTVTTATGGSVSATVNSSTRFMIRDANGDGSRNLSDLTVGQQVEMITVDSNGTTLALAIGGGDRGGHGPRGDRTGDAPDSGDEQQGDSPRPAPKPQGDSPRGPRGDSGQGPRGPRGPGGPRGGR